MVSEIDIKVERLCSMLSNTGFGAVLINSQHNFSWITSGASNGIDVSRDAGAASILVSSDGNRYLLASNIEMQRMLAEQVSANDFEPIEYRWQDEKSSPAFVLDSARRLAAGEIVTEAAIESMIAECRSNLTETERTRFRELGRDASAGVMRTISRISPDETEIEIAEKLRHELASAEINSVVTLVAADERISQFRHPVPTAKKFEKTVLLVTCAKRHGLIASLSRMVNVGEPSDELKRKTEATAYVHASLLNTTRIGATGSELYKTAAKSYANKGFAGEIDLHHQGGATGYRTRDWVAHSTSEETVKPNQAFAWNPSVTGTKSEETFIVTENGIEVITASPDFPTIETVLEGTTYSTPDILAI